MPVSPASTMTPSERPPGSRCRASLNQSPGSATSRAPDLPSIHRAVWRPAAPIDSGSAGVLLQGTHVSAVPYRGSRRLEQRQVLSTRYEYRQPDGCNSAERGPAAGYATLAQVQLLKSAAGA